MEDQKCHMRRLVVVPQSAAVLRVAVVLMQLGATPEPFSIWCQHRQEMGGAGESTRTWAAVLLMGHLDVWAYVIQSQRAAPNHPPIAGIQLRGDRSAACLLHPGGHGSGNRSRQGPEASLSPSTSPSSSAHTQVLSYCPCNSWSDLDLPLENLVGALCRCIQGTQTERRNCFSCEKRKKVGEIHDGS